MMLRHHLIGASVLGISTFFLLDYSIIHTPLFISGTLLGGILPDIDHTQSFIGRRLLLFSKPINKYFGHRTLTHSLVILSLCAISNIISNSLSPILLGLYIGILSHIVLDCLTPAGVCVLYPISRKRLRLIPRKYKRKRSKKRRYFII